MERKIWLHLVLLFMLCSCTSNKSVHRQSLLSNISIGDKVNVITTYNREFLFTVEKVNAYELSGEGFHFEVKDIKEVQDVEFSVYKSSALVLAVAVAVGIIAVLATPFSNFEGVCMEPCGGS